MPFLGSLSSLGIRKKGVKWDLWPVLWSSDHFCCSEPAAAVDFLSE